MAKLIQFQVITGDGQVGKSAEEFTVGATVYALDDQGHLWLGKRQQDGLKWSHISNGPTMGEAKDKQEST